MKSLSVIKSEHRNLGAVLFTLERLTEEIEKGKHPDFRAFHGLLTYIDRFLDEYHHPKEDQYLFPALRNRCPGIAATLDEREHEHHVGEKLLADAFKGVSAYEFLGESEFAAFSSTLRRYVAFEREHAIQEEKHILPLAREKLHREDWDRIDAVFADNEDPMFGGMPRAGFADLHTLITSVVPAPYGLGPDWREEDAP